jgi:hypothetical protein
MQIEQVGLGLLPSILELLIKDVVGAHELLHSCQEVMRLNVADSILLEDLHYIL